MIFSHAMDLVMNDTSRICLKTTTSTLLVEVDFELFATALKNLLDNALKHARGDILVVLSEKSIKVNSLGDKLLEHRLDFTRPFNREMEGSTAGLGLGLYIVNAIVQKHGFCLTYDYEDGQNCFTIHC